MLNGSHIVLRPAIGQHHCTSADCTLVRLACKVRSTHIIFNNCDEDNGQGVEARTASQKSSLTTNDSTDQRNRCAQFDSGARCSPPWRLSGPR